MNRSKYGKVTAELREIPEDEPVFVLRGKDVLAPTAVEGYSALLVAAREGWAAGQVHSDDAKSMGPIVDGVIEEFDRMIDEVRGAAAEMLAWQAENPDKVRIPD